MKPASPIQINRAVMESETATVETFAYFGTDTVIISPDSETFVPGFPYFTDLQSNQLLVSQSNQTVISMKPAQVSREIYDVENTQYSNMPFSDNLNAPGAKTVALTKSSVDHKKCPTQNSLRARPGGRNAEAILHFRSNSASDEAEEQQVIDERKQKRMLSNRESARRCRRRKQHQLDELRAQVAHLKTEHGEILKKLNVTSQNYAHITEENCLLRSETLKLQELHYTLNAQSHVGAHKTMGIETRYCSPAHVSLESWVSPDQWF